MRQQVLNVYTFDELNDKAKEKARDKYRIYSEYPWHDESRQSIEAFCNHFGVKLKKWMVDAWCYDYSTDATNENFRGMKLKDFNRDNMPTGYCLDCDLWMTFYDSFKRSGDAKDAFDDALRAAFQAWCKDIEYHFSDDAIDETMIANDYEFYENGEMI